MHLLLGEDQHTKSFIFDFRTPPFTACCLTTYLRNMETLSDHLNFSPWCNTKIRVILLRQHKFKSHLSGFSLNLSLTLTNYRWRLLIAVSPALPLQYTSFLATLYLTPLENFLWAPMNINNPRTQYITVPRREIWFTPIPNWQFRYHRLYIVRIVR